MKSVIIPDSRHDTFEVNALEVTFHPTLAQAYMHDQGVDLANDLSGLTLEDISNAIAGAAEGLQVVYKHRLDHFYHNGHNVDMPLAPRDMFILKGFPDTAYIRTMYLSSTEVYMFIFEIAFLTDHTPYYIVDTFGGEVSKYTYNLAWLEKNV